MTSTTLTLTGLAISLAVLYANLRPWWRGGHEARALVPFGSGFALGAVSTICGGGILGWLAGCSARVANTGGARGVRMVTGSGDTSPLPRGDLGTLTAPGALIVFLMTIGVVIAWKAAGKKERRRMFGGGFCGATLCLTAGIAGLLAWLPDLINGAGQQIAAMVGSAAGSVL